MHKFGNRRKEIQEEETRSDRMKNWKKGKRKRSRQEEWEELQSFLFPILSHGDKKGKRYLFPPFLLSRPRTVFNGTLSICSFISCMPHPSSRNLTLLEFLHPSHSLYSFIPLHVYHLFPISRLAFFLFLSSLHWNPILTLYFFRKTKSFTYSSFLQFPLKDCSDSGFQTFPLFTA